MKPSEQPLSGLDRELIDSLVEGELSEAERRALLKRLDQTPGGWRACALAFLEAQCFREVLAKDASREPFSLPPTGNTSPARTTRRSPGVGPRTGWQFALAAAILVSLGLGWWASALLRPGASDGALTEVTNLASNHDSNAGRGLRQPSGSSPAEAGPTMTLALPGWAGEGPVHLPVVEREELDPSLLYPDAQAFPAAIREALRAAGYQVRQSRNLVPVRIQDGRHAVLPVDQVDIHYVGNHIE